MSKVTMSKGKFEGINACANERGVIAAAAMDQRGSLKKAIAKARGDGGRGRQAGRTEGIVHRACWSHLARGRN